VIRRHDRLPTAAHLALTSRLKETIMLVVLAILVLSAPAIVAADTSLPGKVLLVKDGRRLKMVARPAPEDSGLPAPPAGGAGDPTVAGALISVVDELAVSGTGMLSASANPCP
jgi:hypothetical protein